MKNQEIDQNPASAKIDATVEAWFGQNVNNSPVARHEDAYNHLYLAKESLKKQLKEALS